MWGRTRSGSWWRTPRAGFRCRCTPPSGGCGSPSRSGRAPRSPRKRWSGSWRRSPTRAGPRTGGGLGTAGLRDRRGARRAEPARGAARRARPHRRAAVHPAGRGGGGADVPRGPALDGLALRAARPARHRRLAGGRVRTRPAARLRGLAAAGGGPADARVPGGRHRPGVAGPGQGVAPQGPPPAAGRGGGDPLGGAADRRGHLADLPAAGAAVRRPAGPARALHGAADALLRPGRRGGAARRPVRRRAGPAARHLRTALGAESGRRRRGAHGHEADRPGVGDALPLGDREGVLLRQIEDGPSWWAEMVRRSDEAVVPAPVPLRLASTSN